LPGRGVSVVVDRLRARIGTLTVSRSALSGEVGVAIEMLLTTAEQVRTTGRVPPDYA